MVAVLWKGTARWSLHCMVSCQMALGWSAQADAMFVAPDSAARQVLMSLACCPPPQSLKAGLHSTVVDHTRMRFAQRGCNPD